jgi:hypothetical protein
MTAQTIVPLIPPRARSDAREIAKAGENPLVVLEATYG